MRVLFLVLMLWMLSVLPAWAQAGPPLSPTEVAHTSTADLWSYVVGALSPLVLAVIIQTHWDSRAQAVTAVLYSVIVGAVTAYVNHILDNADVVTMVVRVFFLAIVSYYGFWKPVGAAPAIMRATTVGRRPLAAQRE